jgi:hypothetical protein
MRVRIGLEPRSGELFLQRLAARPKDENASPNWIEHNRGLVWNPPRWRTQSARL